MPRKKRTYTVVGEAPITVGSDTYRKDDEFEAHEKDVAFFVQIGAVEAKKDK